MIRLRPFRAEDRFLVRRWLQEPEGRTWRGNTASGEAEITFILQSASSLSRIVERGSEPVGYAHAVEVGMLAPKLPEGVRAGTAETTYFLSAAAGDPRMGAAVLDLLTSEVFATTLAIACSATVPLGNEAAARCFERAGFRWVRVLQEPHLGPCWLMLKERPPPAR